MDNVEECLPYLTHLREEHRELHQLVGTIQAQCSPTSALQGSERIRQVLDGLNHLHETLQHHFAEEEAGGCIEEAVCRRPALSSEASILESQHPALLAQLERIIEEARSVSIANRDASDQILARFNSFAQELLDHEAVENRVLQRGFNVDLDLGE